MLLLLMHPHYQKQYYYNKFLFGVFTKKQPEKKKSNFQILVQVHQLSLKISLNCFKYKNGVTYSDAGTCIDLNKMAKNCTVK